MSIKLITDTGISLNKEIIENLDIDIIPIIVTDEEKSYRDYLDITADEVYKNMKGGTLYKTSQISLNTYYEIFSKYAKEKKRAVYLAMSSGLSSTYYTSIMALNQVKEDYPGTDIEILDSKLCATAQGICVLKMYEAIKNGKDIEKIKSILKYMQENSFAFGYVNDMEYLYRGGRMSRTTSKIINALNIKPFICGDENGVLKLFDKTRGNKKIGKKVIEIIEDRLEKKDFSENKIWICHTDNIEDSERLKDVLKEHFEIDDDAFVINQIGASIGVHVGPGSMFIFFLKK